MNLEFVDLSIESSELKLTIRDDNKIYKTSLKLQEKEFCGNKIFYYLGEFEIEGKLYDAYIVQNKFINLFLKDKRKKINFEMTYPSYEKLIQNTPNGLKTEWKANPEYPQYQPNISKEFNDEQYILINDETSIVLKLKTIICRSDYIFEMLENSIVDSKGYEELAYCLRNPYDPHNFRIVNDPSNWDSLDFEDKLNVDADSAIGEILFREQEWEEQNQKIEDLKGKLDEIGRLFIVDIVIDNDGKIQLTYLYRYIKRLELQSKLSKIVLEKLHLGPDITINYGAIENYEIPLVISYDEDIEKSKLDNFFGNCEYHFELLIPVAI